MKFQLDTLVQEYELLEQELASPDVYSNPKKLKDLMLKKKQLEEPVVLYREYVQVYTNLSEAKEILKQESDEDMIVMAKEEISEAESRIADLEDKLQIALLPKDPNDNKNVIFEVRAGTGGEEAALFAGELAGAYMNFAREEGYSVEVLEESRGDSKGSVKEVVMKIS